MQPLSLTLSTKQDIAQNDLADGGKVMLFNSRLRICVFRFIIVTSVLDFIFVAVWFRVLSDLLPLFFFLFVFIHHLLSALYSRRWLFSVLDLVFVSLEISVWFALGFYRLYVDRWSTQSDIIFVISVYTQITGLATAWLCRLAALTKGGIKGLLKPFDLQAGVHRPRAYSRLSILFGRAIWRPRHVPEPKGLIATRGLFALGFISGLIAFGILAMIIEPIQETGLTPTKFYHATDLVYDFEMADPVWSIIAFIDMNVHAASRVDEFKAAVNVSALWDDRGSKPECVHLPGNRTFGGHVPDVQSDPYIQTITIFCPNRLGYLPTAQEAMSLASSQVTPDLLITVNFTKLGMDSSSLVDARKRTVSILVGLTNDTADVLANTMPTPLFPNSHICGSVSREFRRRFVKPSFAAFGSIGSSSRTFLVTDLVALTTDNHPLIPRSENTATLRVYGQNDFSEWTVDQDFREKSVWGGIAAVGGFWTFINGAFTVLFGGSLLLVFGRKPLTLFGVVDGLRKEDLRRDWNSVYTALREEKNAKPGLLALLRDYVVDLEAIDEGAEGDMLRATDLRRVP